MGTEKIRTFIDSSFFTKNGLVREVIIESGKAKAPKLGNPLAEATGPEELLVQARKTVEEGLNFTRSFIDDPYVDQVEILFPMASAVDNPETLDKIRKAGTGTTIVFTKFKPVNMELYRSLIPNPLVMPDEPEVYVSMVDYNNGQTATRYLEGFVNLKVKCPDGKESWLLKSVPVTSVLMWGMGCIMGWPKYIADEMSLSQAGASAIYEGEVRMSLDLTPGPVKEAEGLRKRLIFGKDGFVVFYPAKAGFVPLRSTFDKDPHFFELETGMVKVHFRPQDPWAGLLPTEAVFPGIYGRFIPAGKHRAKKFKIY